MMTKETIELRRRCAQLVQEMQAVLTRARGESRALNADEETSYKKMEADLDAWTETIQREERLADRAAEYERGAPGAGTPAPAANGAQERAAEGPRTYGRRALDLGARAAAEYDRAWCEYLRRGERMDPQLRATLQVDSDAGGGYLAASERMIGGLLQALDRMSVVRSRVTTFTCRYGETLGAPSLDGDLSDFEWGAGELTAASEDTGLSFGKRELKPHPLKRKLVKVSKRLIESPNIDPINIVNDRAAVSLARTLAQGYLTGSGALRPLGLFTASDDGIPTSRDVSTSNTATAPTYLGLMAAQNAVDMRYDAVWLGHQDFYHACRQIVDGTGRPIFEWAPDAQVPQRLLGRPALVDNYCPNTFTASQYVGLYGDLSYYYAADAVSLTVQVLNELYASTGQIGLLFDRLAADGMPVQSAAFARVKLAAGE